MKKISLLTAACLLAAFLASCATLGTMSDEFQPLSKRLISASEVIRAAAVKEFAALDNDRKKETLIETVKFFKDADPIERSRILSLLTDMKAGGYVIIPLIMAAAQNGSANAVAEARQFLINIKPDLKDIPEYLKLMKSEKWEVRIMAMEAVSNLSRGAEKVFPEIVDNMKEFGRDPGKYEETLNTLLKINPEMAINALIINLTDKDSELRKNTVAKLVEMQAYLSSKLAVKKDIIPALSRALYDEDKGLSEYAQDALSKMEDPAAKAQLESFLKMGRAAMSGLARFAGTSLKELFKTQENKTVEKMRDYYKKIGREDAIGK